MLLSRRIDLHQEKLVFNREMYCVTRNTIRVSKFCILMKSRYRDFDTNALIKLRFTQYDAV
jgi:hypothetical protein